MPQDRSRDTPPSAVAAVRALTGQLDDAELFVTRAVGANDRGSNIASTGRLLSALLAGCGAARLLQTPMLSVCLTIPLGLWLLSEYRGGPFPTSDLGPAPFYAALPPDGRALLELPMTRDAAKRSMLQQSYHRRPIVNGMVARAGGRPHSPIEASPLLNQLSARHVKRYRCGDFDLAGAWQRLHELGVGYVVVDNARTVTTTGKPTATLRSYLPAQPFLRSRGRSAYRIWDLVSASPACK